MLSPPLRPPAALDLMLWAGGLLLVYDPKHQGQVLRQGPTTTAALELLHRRTTHASHGVLSTCLLVNVTVLPLRSSLVGCCHRRKLVPLEQPSPWSSGGIALRAAAS